MKINLPKTGDTRVRKGFLFFPRIIEHEMRWLEYAEWVEEWSGYLQFGLGCWVAIAWAEEAK